MYLAPNTQEIPVCLHALDEPVGGLRECAHPQLQGLKLVTAELCSGCSYREVASQEGASPVNRENQLTGTAQQDFVGGQPVPGRLWDCAYLDATNAGVRYRTPHSHPAEGTSPIPQRDLPLQSAFSHDTWLDQLHLCRHPAHRHSTRRQCGNCADYLFPQFSPRMTVEDARRLLTAQQGVQPAQWWKWPNVQTAFRQLADEAIGAIGDYPLIRFQGRGVVIAGGGRYFPSAYVTVRVLRHVGCRLPIQLWHFAGEIDEVTRGLLAPWDVTCVDAEEVCRRNGEQLHLSWWKGWQLKPYAILHAPFEEVLYLDADSYPIRNPEFLFNWIGFRKLGAIFWPDIDGSSGLLPPDRPPIFGVPSFQDRPTESGQLLINKRDCWREVNLAWFYNSHAEFTYRALWGDKDTFPIAWKKLGRAYARMWPTASANSQAVLQFDDAGCVLFQHRVTDKFRIGGTRFDSTHQPTGENQYNPDLIHEDFCFAVLNELVKLAVT